MNRSIFYPLLLMLCCISSAKIFAQIYAPEGLNLPGQWNGWNNPSANKPAFGSSTQVSGGQVTLNSTGTPRYTTRIHIDSLNADTTKGTYAFLFTSGPANSPWNNKWANVTVLMDSLQTYTYQGNTDNSITVSNGKYYHMNWADNGYASTDAVFMELSNMPVAISNVKRSPSFITPSDSVLISFTISNTPSPEEHFFVRYTTTNWQTSAFVEATIASTTGEAYIPALTNGTQVSYYVLSSTKSNPSYAFDLYTLEYENNGGANYTYTVATPSFKLSLDQSQYCSGSSGQLNYSYSIAFDPANQFTIELSDAAGSFASPVSLGTFQSAASVDSFSFTLPGSASGASYLIRLISSNPSDTGLTSTFSINSLPLANAISGNDTTCLGDSAVLSLVALPNETITWYASGQLLGTGNQVMAPQGQPISAVVTNTCGSDTASFFIFANTSPSVSLAASGSTALCYGDSVLLSWQTSAQASLTWTFNGQPLNVSSSSFYVSQAGKYAVQVDGNPCPSGYAEVNVTLSGCGIYRPEGINLPGQWNGWVNPASNKPNLGSDVQVSGGNVVLKNIGTRRYQTIIPIGASGDTTTGTYEFLFTSGPVSNPWSNKWGGTTVILDSLQSYTYQGQNNTISVIDGSWYTMNYADNGYADTRAIFMSTSAEPVDIVSVSQSPNQVFDAQTVSVSFTLSQTPSPEEKFVVRYTMDGWQTSDVVWATMNQTTGTATIPGAASGTEVAYYVLSTTKNYPVDDWDLHTIHWNNNSNKNYRYLVETPFISLGNLPTSSYCGGTYMLIPAAFGGISATSNITGEVSDDQGSFTNATMFAVSWNASTQAFEGYLPTTLVDGTRYRVRLKDLQGTAISSPNGVDLTISEAPQFITQAGGSLMFCAGDSVLLSVTAISGTQTYQWYNGAQAIIGATQADFVAKSAGTYYVQVVNAANGCSLNTKEWTVQVSAAAPVDQVSMKGGYVICDGDSTILSQPADPNTNCQWLLNGSPINGATGFSYTVRTTGTFSLQMTNGCGQTVSDTFHIEVLPPVSASISAAGFSICSGDSITLTAPSGNGLTYTWFLDGNVLSGANSASYVATLGGTYRVEVSNASGCSGVSSDFLLTENPKPKALVIPSGSTTFCDGGSVVLNGTPGAGLSYQWRKNGIDIPGATSQAYQVTTGGDYSVMVLNASGCAAVSSAKTITVNPIPAKPVIAVSGNTLSAPQGYSYVWYKNGVVLSGATNASYTVQDTGCYQVQISDGIGCSNASDTVCIQSLVNGLPQVLNSNWVLFPNPSSDVFHVQGLPSGCRLSIYDVTGQQIMQSVVEGKSDVVIDAVRWTAGIYLMRIELGEQIVQKTIIKQ